LSQDWQKRLKTTRKIEFSFAIFVPAIIIFIIWMIRYTSKSKFLHYLCSFFGMIRE
jgi:hypothetical protein